MQETRLNSINNRLISAGHLPIDCESELGKCLLDAQELEMALKINGLLDAASKQPSANQRDAHGALLCLTDGTLDLHSSSHARRLVNMLYQTCVSKSSSSTSSPIKRRNRDHDTKASPA